MLGVRNGLEEITQEINLKNEILVSNQLSYAIEEGIKKCLEAVYKVDKIIYIIIDGEELLCTKARIEYYLNMNMIFRKLVIGYDGKPYYPQVPSSTYRISFMVYEGIKTKISSIKEKELNPIDRNELWEFLSWCNANYGDGVFTSSDLYNTTPYKKLPRVMKDNSTVIGFGRALNTFVNIPSDNFILRKRMNSKQSYYYVEEINV